MTLIQKACVFVVSVLLVSCHRTSLLMRGDESSSGRDDVAVSYYRDEGGELVIKSVENALQPRKKVLVLEFWNDTPVKIDGLGKFVAEDLKRQLEASQRVILPESMLEVGKTEDFVEGNRVKVSQLIREGRKLGVAVTIIGRIIRVALRQKGDEVGLFRQKQSLASIELEMKVFDVSAGREVYSGTKTREVANESVLLFGAEDWDSPIFKIELAKGAARECITDMLPNILTAVDKMIWEGRVAKINGTKVYVNAGQLAGLATGDILRVFTPGDEIFDPVTGAQLGRGQGQLKGTLEVKEFVGTDGAMTLLHTGGNMKEGDIVQLY